MPSQEPLHAGEPDLAGKTMVVTGATSGIGLAAARGLAGRGAFVIGVGRTEEHMAAAREDILAQFPAARIVFLPADLSSQRQILTLGALIHKKVQVEGGGKLDVLVNNAGSVANWYTATEDGYELQFAVNHLAPFLLTHELLPALKAAPIGRVITVSSSSHRHGHIHWADVMLRRNYNTLWAYQQSKLANVLFTYEFNRRYGRDSNLRAFVADPGLVNTEIGLKGTSGIVRWIWDRRRKKGTNPDEGAATILFLASDADVGSGHDIYWKKCRPLSPGRNALREEEAARLWELSERLCGIPHTQAPVERRTQD